MTLGRIAMIVGSVIGQRQRLVEKGAGRTRRSVSFVTNCRELNAMYIIVSSKMEDITILKYFKNKSSRGCFSLRYVIPDRNNCLVKLLIWMPHSKPPQLIAESLMTVRVALNEAIRMVLIRVKNIPYRVAFSCIRHC